MTIQRRMVHTENKYIKIPALGIPIGGIAGLLGSMLGVGGGVIMVLRPGFAVFNSGVASNVLLQVPLMVCRPLSLQARHASATSLVAVVGTGLVSAVR